MLYTKVITNDTTMNAMRTLLFSSIFFFISTTAQAAQCCGGMGGINYCDSSAGRLVCNNGFYSTCYCTRHAVMNLQLLKGCCLWHGGVAALGNPANLIICNDGSVSEECTLEQPNFNW